MVEQEGQEQKRFTRIELPEEDHLRLTAAAKRLRLPLAAYVRLAVMERIASDEKKLS